MSDTLIVIERFDTGYMVKVVGDGQDQKYLCRNKQDIVDVLEEVYGADPNSEDSQVSEG